ncbi:MAG: hypothetical protein KA449_01025 [Pelolinea sp.]|nr:hypothetical protein [Pelolinea sp.]
MYSIIIAVLFFILSAWLLKREWAKDPSVRNMWNMLSAIFSLVVGVAVFLMWLITMIL